MTKKERWIWLVSVFAVNVALDRVTKLLATDFLRGKGTVRAVSDLFVLRYVENDGAFLSLGAGWYAVLKYAVLLVIPLAICLGGLVYCAVKEQNKTRLILIATILAGGLSNLFDRLTRHFRVVDFMNFGIGGLRTGILNVADLSITFGGIALVLYVFLRSEKPSPGAPKQE
jgi:signal peptidase II